EFDNVRVPEEHILGELDSGYQTGQEGIGFDRGIVVSRTVATAARLLEMAVDDANTSKTFGKTIAARLEIQWQIAQSTLGSEPAKLLVLNAAFTLDQGEDNRHQASMAKVYGDIIGNNVVDRVMQIHGGMGYTKEFPIERWYREARLWRIY